MSNKFYVFYDFVPAGTVFGIGAVVFGWCVAVFMPNAVLKYVFFVAIIHLIYPRVYNE